MPLGPPVVRVELFHIGIQVRNEEAELIAEAMPAGVLGAGQADEKQFLGIVIGLSSLSRRV